MSPGNSTRRTRKRSRCNTTPQNPSIFHLLASAVKLGQRHTAQRSSEPVPETSPLSEAGVLHPRAAGKETGCFEKPQQGERETSGTQRHGETRGHRLQSTSQAEISSDAACSSPCLHCQTAQLQSKPRLTQAGEITPLCFFVRVVPSSPKLSRTKRRAVLSLL